MTDSDRSPGDLPPPEKSTTLNSSAATTAGGGGTAARRPATLGHYRIIRISVKAAWEPCSRRNRSSLAAPSP